MTNGPVGRVFDDENDRSIAVMHDETERDALLRARRDGLEDRIPRKLASTPNKIQSNPWLTLLWCVSVSLITVGVLVTVWALTTFPEYNPALDANASIILGEQVHLDQDLNPIENYLWAIVGASIANIGAFTGFCALVAAAINWQIRTSSATDKGATVASQKA